MNIHKAEPPPPVVTTGTYGKASHSSRDAQWPRQPGMHQHMRPTRHTVAPTGLAAGRGHRHSRSRRPVGPACCGTPGRAPQCRQGSHIHSCSVAAEPPGSPVWDSHLAQWCHSLASSPPASSFRRPVHQQLGPHPAEPGHHVGSH